MAVRACALLFLAFTVAAARECIELTLSDKSLLTDSILNGTILKLAAKNESFQESGLFNVVEMWERFPKIVVPRNGTSEQCRRDSQLYLDSLERLELWALKSKYMFFLFSYAFYQYNNLHRVLPSDYCVLLNIKMTVLFFFLEL